MVDGAHNAIPNRFDAFDAAGRCGKRREVSDLAQAEPVLERIMIEPLQAASL
jgi:hypothetical protein